MGVDLREVDNKARFQVNTAMVLKIPVRRNVMMCALPVGTE